MSAPGEPAGRVDGGNRAEWALIGSDVGIEERHWQPKLQFTDQRPNLYREVLCCRWQHYPFGDRSRGAPAGTYAEFECQPHVRDLQRHVGVELVNGQCKFLQRNGGLEWRQRHVGRRDGGAADQRRQLHVDLLG